ncbi:helix-turn-helix transcriptional regulator [Limosilactobacillus reuteri]|uniref:helix-turn-helix domain-containing protein n=1 Tax=Limosilactobacillus reuteri TaxID=1598 RepID=UPI0015F98DC9|nr:helix-turn-helix transcriptional regulator [Limosilactobacillus reuteri]MBB1072675.1 helix-turn-helix transcriptional regulator [Limosilactobacillus reuteri]MCC4510955.1 helix-turn-helix transcriptional regulator [Limosilactobacillus reuteri]MCC4513787.1 helix-turn-helix transcriptional regulator [Limosilactobacillus reuteri]
MKEGVSLIANRLKILLAERDLSIKNVMGATGISRSALSNMVNNPFANISTENVDKLCNYLEVKPSEFYDYVPWIFHFTLHLGTMKVDDLYQKKGEAKSGELEIAYISGHVQRKTVLNFDTHIKADYSDPVDEYDLYMHLSNFDGDDSFTEIFESMSPFFKHYVQQKIVEAAKKVIALKDKNHEFDKLISESNGELDNKLDISVNYLSEEDESLLQTSFTYNRKDKDSEKA